MNRGGILSENDRKSNLSFSYLHALSSAAGFACELGPNPDRYSVDAIIRSGEPGKPQIDVQLKSTSAPDLRDDGLHFRLGAKNYNDLREIPRGCPIILVVLELPEDSDEWISVNNDGMTIRARAWWQSIEGLPEIADGSSKTVVLPESQILTPESLVYLMSRAGDLIASGGVAL